MTAALHIRRLRTRYHVTARGRGAVARLDRIQRAVLDDALTAALDRLGIDGRREICVRKVASRVTVSLDARDDEIAHTWARAMALRIRAAVDAGSADVVHYGSRHEALLDAAASLAAGDDRRAWAWRQLGLLDAGRAGGTRDGDPAAAPGEALLGVLLGAAPIAPAILAALVRQGLAARLAALVPDSGWSALARAALVQNGLSTSALDQAGHAGHAAPPLALVARARERAQQLAGRSVLARLIAPAGAASGGAVAARGAGTGAAGAAVRDARVPDDAVAARAALALLEVEPAAFAGAPDDVAALLAELARAATGANVAESTASDGESTANGGERAAGPAATAPSPSPAPGPRDRAGRPAPAGARHEPPRPQATPAAGSEESAPSPRVHARVTGETEHGGLPFLLHLVRDRAVPDIFTAWLDGDGPELGPGRTFRGLLHALGRTLVALPADDPAALAFAGLPPDAAPPTRDEPPATEAEGAALAALAADLLTELRRRIDRPDEPAPRLLTWLCRRRARIVADPGWLDVELALDDISTEIRRSGLDLDLGWLPWLGVAVRFLYA